MIKASEDEMKAIGHSADERRIASNSNLRYIYRETSNTQARATLPQSVINIIERAKEKRKKFMRGKGKNDIETLMMN